jgi:hypothetical protein
MLGAAVSQQLRRLVLRGATTLSDLGASAVMGPYSWNRLTSLEIEGAGVSVQRTCTCDTLGPAAVVQSACRRGSNQCSESNPQLKPCDNP